MFGGDIGAFWGILAEHFRAYHYAKSQEQPNPKLALVLSSISTL